MPLVICSTSVVGTHSSQALWHVGEEWDDLLIGQLTPNLQDGSTELGGVGRSLVRVHKMVDVVPQVLHRVEVWRPWRVIDDMDSQADEVIDTDMVHRGVVHHDSEGTVSHEVRVQGCLHVNVE